MIIEVIDWPRFIEVKLLEQAECGYRTLRYRYRVKHEVASYQDLYVQLVSKYEAVCTTTEWSQLSYTIMEYKFDVSDYFKSDVLAWLDSLVVMCQISS
jgi:hypothetical protein